MKKRVYCIICAVIIIIIVCFVLIKNNNFKNINIKKDINDVIPVYEMELKDIGNSYKDEIYEKYDSYHYGKYQNNNIEWIVLKKDDDKVLLLSKYIIDCMPYNNIDEDVLWENCSLKMWLNSDFYDTSFNDDEKEMIIDTEYGNIFCLSVEEYNNCFDNGEYYNELYGTEVGNYNGATAPTQYCKNKIKKIYNSNGILDLWKKENEKKDSDTFEYWLRDRKEKYREQNDALIIDWHGGVNDIQISNDIVGVRPAMWIKMSN